MILLDANNNLLLQNNRAFTEQLAMDATAEQYIASANVTDPVRQYAYNVWFTIMKHNDLLNNINVIQFFVNGSPEYDKWNCRLPTTDTDAAFRATFTGITHSSTGITGTGSSQFVDNKWTVSATQMTWFVWSFTNLQYNASVGDMDLELPSSGLTSWAGAYLRNTSNNCLFSQFSRTDNITNGSCLATGITNSTGFFLGKGNKTFTAINPSTKSLYVGKQLYTKSDANPNGASAYSMRIRPHGRYIGMAGATRIQLSQNQIYQLYNATQLCFTIMGLI